MTEISIRNENDLKVVLSKQYQKQIDNFFGDPKKSLEFLSNVVSSVQRVPKLLDCTPQSLINSFIMMASLKLMPSGVSGEAYVLPYENRGKGVSEAQFQLGYPGIVTLLYRAGNTEVVAELVRENDKFALSRGKVIHEVDPRKTKSERGDWIGAYAIITTATGGTVEGYMTKQDILEHAKKFSKSFDTKFSPWNADNDPEGWMPRKTVLKQVAKLAPKNETLNRALSEDNKDSVIADRLEQAKSESQSLTMGELANVKNEKENHNQEIKDNEKVVNIA
jgi:recombination protein RecT